MTQTMTGRPSEAHLTKLRGMLDEFDIPIAAAAQVAGCSRALLSRMLSGDQRVKGSMVLLKLEERLGDLVNKRQQVYLLGDNKEGKVK